MVGGHFPEAVVQQVLGHRRQVVDRRADMKKFEYRTPRFQADLPVQFRLQNTSMEGRCIEIGKEGMKVKLAQPVARDVSGTISLEFHGLAIELRASVAHCESDHYGLRFLFESEKDRSAVERLVSLLSASSGQPGPVLVR